MSLARVIRAYSKTTELSLWEIRIETFSLCEFQAEFGVEDPHNPMYDCWPVRPENVPFLERYITNKNGWNFELADYFVEADAS
ncbi:MAG: hypothetical protein QM776_08865 [Rhodocyclaceae bacterium]